MSDTAWDLRALRSYFESSGSNATFAIRTIDSIARGVDIFRYHVLMARDAMKGLIDENNAIASDPLLLAFGQSPKQKEFAYARIVSEANLIGCLQTARNLWDLTAQLLNVALNQTPIPEARCDLAQLQASLHSSPMKTSLETVTASADFQYITAFVNTTKHRRLVGHSLSISFEENRVGMRIGEFEYGGVHYPAVWGTEGLEAAIRVKNQVISSGRLLNTVLGV